MMSERKWCCSVLLQWALAKRITTLTIRWQIERGPGRHISHQQASNEGTKKAVAGSLLLLAQRPFICREAWNLQLFLSFFLILPQLPRESCLFLGPPTTQEKCRVQFHYTERLNGLWLFFAWNLNSVSHYGKTTRYCTKATNNLLKALSRDK